MAYFVIFGSTNNPRAKIDFKLQAIHLGITKFCFMNKSEKGNPYPFQSFLKVNFHIICAFIHVTMFLPKNLYFGWVVIQAENSEKKDGWDGGDGREVREGRDICTHIADSLRCIAETNTTL